MNTSKIIKGVVGGGRYTVTAPIVKEDYGLYLKIEGLELPSTYEVDFSNSEHNGTSVTMIGNSDGVLIPHQFIDTGKDVFAFLYHVGVDFGRTVYKFRIPNKLRPDRTNEQPTPEQQSTIDQAIAALNNAVEQTAQDVIDANASAQSASDSADRAEIAEQDAENAADVAHEYADRAETSASQASASATVSAQSASQSAQIKSDVEGMVDDAQGYAQSAEQSAQNAHTYALSANAASSTAENFADVASSYASQARSSSQTASAKASEASTSTSTASTKATESAQSASQALTYKTDAESAKTASQTAQGLAESARDTAVQAKTDAESARDEAQNLVDGISGKVEQIDQNTVDIASLEEDRYKPYVVDSASGSIASFPDGADDIPLKSLVVDINPVQDLSSGDPSPTNICPISGWTGMQLSVNGTVIPINWQSEAGTVYGGQLDMLSGKLTVEMASIQIKDTSWTTPSTNVFRTELDKKLGMLIPMSDAYKSVNSVASTANLPNDSISVHRYAGSAAYRVIVYIKDTRYTEPSDFVSAMGEHQIVYALNTPITYQLTPHEVRSLLGTNNIFADTGDTSAEYRADTTLYISRLTEPDADMVADANIVSGQYFMVGNSLFKATANIASGASVIVGTNAIRKSLSEALNEINA